MKAKRATLNDIEDIAELFDQYRVFYDQKSDINSAIQFLTERMKGQESVLFFVESDDGRKAGFVHLYPLFSSVQMKRLWLLNDLFVHANFRGLGLSEKLIESAKDHCRQTNACELMLETQKNNHPANRLYEKTGFVLNEHNFYAWSE